MPGPRPIRHAKVRRAKLRHNEAALAELRRLATDVWRPRVTMDCARILRRDLEVGEELAISRGFHPTEWRQSDE